MTAPEFQTIKARLLNSTMKTCNTTLQYEDARADMAETITHNTKVSDSAYSNSSNSQSQRSSGSSKSRHSNSSGSSGYGGHAPSIQGSGEEPFPQPLITKHIKDKEHKKKKLKSSSTAVVSPAGTTAAENENVVGCLSVVVAGAATSLPGTTAEGTEITEAGSEKSAVSNHVGVAWRTAGAVPTATSGPENEVQQMAPLTCVKPLRKSKEIAEETEGQFLPLPVIPAGKKEQILNNFEVEPSTKNEGEFSVVVSMQDGLVVFTTPNITDVVGFPLDMWLGRSFIDFVRPKDRAGFTSHITSGVVTPLTHTHAKGGPHAGKSSFYCCLQRYQGLKCSGYCVTEKEVAYLPFQLNMTFREFVSQGTPADQEGSIDPEVVTGGCNIIFLVITAKRVFSAYKHAGQTCVSPKFVTCHLASCQLSHIDPESMPYLGYLPQDMLGKCVLEFYHPEDLPFLKEIYQTVMMEHGSSFRSKPYRYRAQNGSYVLLETEWSSFVNPWSKKLEFVIGQHRVLKGPDNTDVFVAPGEDENEQISEEVMKESKVIKEDIKCLLSKIIRNSVQIERQPMSEQYTDLANFVENLMDVSKSEFQVELTQEGRSFSEQDSVMLGGISPHHDYCDSKSSTETPPSYNQLNYNDNIQRFFESKPKTTLSDESGESKIEADRLLMSADEEEKDRPAADSSLGCSNRKCCSPLIGSGSGSGSRSGHSSGSAGIGESAESRQEASATNISRDLYKPPVLTEALLSRHNEDMEKKMVQKHKEQRNKGSERENKLKNCIREKLLQEHCRGVKRNGLHCWEGEPSKASKHPHIEGGKFNPGNGGGCVNQCLGAGNHYSGLGSMSPLCQGGTNVNLWPPFSITSLQPTTPCSTHGFSTNNMPTSPQMANMIPMYYIPTNAQQASLGTAECLAPQEHPDPPRMPPPGVTLPVQPPTFIPQQVPYLNATTAAMLCQYPPVYGGPPVMYPSMTVLQPATALFQAPGSQPNIAAAATCKQESKSPVIMSSSGIVSSKFQRPASQATSVKAEPGSATASLASASVKRGMSDSSKKEKSLSSPAAGWTVPNVSQDDEKVMKFEPDKRDTESGTDAFSATRDIEVSGDDSSYSSFYSFLKTDKSDTSMKSSLGCTNANPVYKAEEMVWEKSENQQPLKSRPALKDPPWMEEVHLTPDLVYRYQMKDHKLTDVLQADLKILENNQQPFLVNDQLSQLYLDMELEGLSTRLKLEEGITSSSSSSGEDVQSNAPENESFSKGRRKRRSVEYGKLVMIFEENAPFPPPCTN